MSRSQEKGSGSTGRRPPHLAVLLVVVPALLGQGPRARPARRDRRCRASTSACCRSIRATPQGIRFTVTPVGERSSSCGRSRSMSGAIRSAPGDRTAPSLSGRAGAVPSCGDDFLQPCDGEARYRSTSCTRSPRRCSTSRGKRSPGFGGRDVVAEGTGHHARGDPGRGAPADTPAQRLVQMRCARPRVLRHDPGSTQEPLGASDVAPALLSL